jgi:hypothetical protein
MRGNWVGKIIKGGYSEIFKEIPTTYTRKNYERDRWKQEDFESTINAFKERQWASMLPVEVLAFLQGPREEESFRITTKKNFRSSCVFRH